jgi:hypothetical protein
MLVAGNRTVQLEAHTPLLLEMTAITVVEESAAVPLTMLDGWMMHDRLVGCSLELLGLIA